MHGTHPPKQRPRRSHAQRLLAWYDVHRRELPWRAKPGEAAAPYRVWLSEIMLQQTTVQAVAAYYRKFIARWPTVRALAKAPLDDVLAAWAGLGYYARARNLHKAAKMVVDEMDGRFPATALELRKLPGVGAYTSGAIAAIAFGAREAAMDANAERVIARLFAVEKPLPGAKAKLLALGRSLVPEKRAGDFAQALMDLGAGVCTVKRPACGNCPLADDCEARKRGIAETLPVKAPKPARPLRRGAAFVARDKGGAVLLVKRPEKGLLGGMLQPPLGPWGEKFPSTKDALSQAPFRAAWKKLPGLVRHTFTHFELEIEVWTAEVENKSKLSWPANAGHPGDIDFLKKEKLDGRGRPGHDELKEQWVPAAKLKDAALPTVMRKIVAYAFDAPSGAARHLPRKRGRKG
ncbi:MAG: A/G-specific adenine glycosylase [Rhizomicrobium sp.]